MEWYLNSRQLADLATPGQWLDSEQIDFIMQHIKLTYQSSDEGKITVSSTYCAQLTNGNWQYADQFGLEAVELDTGSQEQHLHPLLLNNHWVLLHFDKRKKICTVFDSKYGDKPMDIISEGKRLIENNVLKAFCKDSQYFKDWKVAYFPTMPLQEDSDSCGLYLLRAAEEIFENGSNDVIVRKIENDSNARAYWVRSVVASHGTDTGYDLLEISGNNARNLVNEIRQSWKRVQESRLKHNKP